MSFKNFVKIGQVIKSRKTGNVFVVIATPKSGKTCNVFGLSKKLDKVITETAFLCDTVNAEHFETVSGTTAFYAYDTCRSHLEKGVNRYGSHIVSAFADIVISKAVQWSVTKDWFIDAYRLRRMNKQSAYSDLGRLVSQCYRLPVRAGNLYIALVSWNREEYPINKKDRTVKIGGRDTKLFNY